ncbi:sugar transferase [uncultured Mycolicibacterium sp.]|mgnify:CR=1 FL=1|uniref:sugar transferase n=1 Tax=uncultured Mycolicibacterium sp. TaxID=2320817 RepID=UPI0032B16FC3
MHVTGMLDRPTVPMERARRVTVAAVPAPSGTWRRRMAWEPIVGALVDLTSASAAVAVGMTWANHLGYELPPAWMVCFFAPTVVALSAMGSLYRRSLKRSFLDELPMIEAITALAAVLLLSGLVLRSGVEGSLGSVGSAAARVWMCAAVLVPAGRLLWIVSRRRLFRRDVMKAPMLIVGNGRIAAKVVDRINANPEYGLVPVGLVDDDLPMMGAQRDEPACIPYLGTLADLDDIITRTGAQCMVVAFSRTRDDVMSDAVRVAHRHGLAVWVVPRIFDTIGIHARIDHVGGLPLIAVPHTDPRGWQFVAKHVSDRIFAAAGLLVISPVFLLLMLLVRLSSPGPIFFSQPRVGRDGRVFGCLKFRSMRPPRDSDAVFTRDGTSAPGGVEGEDRRTPIGRILRATSLDELPQLVNVVRGEMSLVGPRPERPEYVDLFNVQIARYGERHRVKAGITGWAQVHGLRGQTSIADRAEWDNFYIENWSLWLDWKILAMTVVAVLRRAE